MPRIFVAIRFNDEFKQKLVEIQDALKKRGVSGNYCSWGNLHMTLAFIGETCDLLAIRDAVSEVKFETFELTLDRLGSFPTKTGVIWCGVKESEPVTTVVNFLRERLSEHDVSYSCQGFVPHISLVQHPSSVVTDVDIPKVSVRVEKIYVMKSERINGELIYSEI